MKILRVLSLAFVALFCVAADPGWNPADAVKEAEQDIRSGHIKSYWAGSVGSDQSMFLSTWLRNMHGLMPEWGMSLTTYRFEDDRKNMPGGIIRKFTPTSLTSIRNQF